MKTTKIILTVLLVALMLSTSIPLAFGAEIVDSGYCGGEGDGTNLSWTLDSDGVLKIVGIGEMRNYWDKSPFVNNLSIKKAIIGEGVTNVGVEAFDSCYNLTTVELPNGLTSIGDRAFLSSALSNIDFPSSLTSIGDSAFWDCRSLTNIIIPNGVKSIGNDAFEKCIHLISVVIPESVISIGGAAFSECSALTSISVAPMNNNYYSDEYGCLYSKDQTVLMQYPSGNSRTTYEIPDGVTNIRVRAFEDSSNLTSIVVPNSVTSIGEEAFRDCTKLERIELPDGLTSINGRVFLGCTALTNFQIPVSVSYIGLGAFSNCSSLMSIEIPKGVTNIENPAFSGCNALEAISVEETNQVFSSCEDGCLYNKDKSILLQYPNGNSRTTFAIPNSVTSVSPWAFSYSSFLENISIPEGVTDIGSDAFWHCINLKSISIPNSISTLGDHCFYECENLTKIELPNSLTYIPYFMFARCYKLSSVEIPVGVTSIGSYAFSECGSLKSISLQNSVVSIDYGAFSPCRKLQDVFYAGSEEDWSRINIGSENNYLINATIHFNHTHTYNTEPITPATCIAPGEGTFTCECGKTYIGELPIDPTNHINTENRDAVASTCTVKGYSAGIYCNDCKTWISGHEEQPLVEHQTVLKNVKEATCTQEGYTGDLYCTTCKQTITKGNSIKALGHTNPDGNGNCTRCGAHIKDVTPTGPEKCKWCGQVHTGFPGTIVGFFHSILYFFAHLFGLR